MIAIFGGKTRRPRGQMLTTAQQLLTRRRQDDDDRLLKLFWNRAELKREFATLRREKDQLIEQLRQQEGETLRGQQRLDQLEGLLSNPARAANAIVYFQLRGVWLYARRRLQRLAQDLAARQLEVEFQREANRFEEHRQAAIAAMEQRLEPLRQRRESLENDLLQLDEKRVGLRGLWNFFRRKTVESERVLVIAALDSVLQQAERYEQAIVDKREEVAVAPDTLSVEGRRVVNLSVIALAQEMLLHFSQHNVAAMARETTLRSVTESTYGSVAECREQSQHIERALRQVDELDGLPSRVRRRTEHLRKEISYRRETDTVPAAGFFSEIPWVISDDSRSQPRDSRTLPVNVLADEYWDLFAILLH